MFTRKKLLLLIIVLLVSPMLVFSSFSGWTPTLEINAGYYGAIPLADYLKTPVPVRTQASAKVYFDPLCFSFGKVQVGAAFLFNYVTPSLTYDSTRLKGFTAVGGRFYLGFFLTDMYCLGLGAEIAVNNWGVYEKFGSVSGIVYNELLLREDPYVNFSLTAPLTVTYRKDILAVSLAVGIKLKLKGSWIIEEDSNEE